MTEAVPQTGYAPVNGLEMYYEIHGSGEPLLLLHGAYGIIDLWEPLLESLRSAGRSSPSSSKRMDTPPTSTVH